MFAKKRSVGRLCFSCHVLDHIETAVRHSFEARRGDLYDALQALDAMLIVDLAEQAVEENFSQREFGQLAFESLNSEREQELGEAFRFHKVVRMARRKFGDLDGVMRALDTLVPAFKAEYEARAAEGQLERRVGIISWLTGKREVGSNEELLQFCEASLWLAQNVLDEDSAFAHLARKTEELMDMLP